MKNLLITLAVATTAAGSAQAAVITFNGAASGPAANIFDVGEYQVKYWYGQTASIFGSVNGFATLGDNQTDTNRGAAFEVTRKDGKAFNLNSVTFGLSAGGVGRVAVLPYSGGATFQVPADGQSVTMSASAYKNITVAGFDAYAQSGGVGIRSLDVTAVGSPVAPVPEPATWGMMILGFGVVGAARRRQAKTVYA